MGLQLAKTTHGTRTSIRAQRDLKLASRELKTEQVQIKCKGYLIRYENKFKCYTQIKEKSYLGNR